MDNLFSLKGKEALFVSGILGIFIYFLFLGGNNDQNKFYYIFLGYGVWFILKNVYWNFRINGIVNTSKYDVTKSLKEIEKIKKIDEERANMINEIIENNLYVEDEEHNEYYDNKDYINTNNQDQDYNKLKQTRKLLKIMIGLNILLIVLIVLLFINVNINSMRINSLTARVEDNSAVLSTVDGLLNGEESTDVEEVNVEVLKETNDINNMDIIKDNFEELVVSGHEIDKSNPYMLTVTGTVTNNSDTEQNYDVQVVFYDKLNKPIALENDSYKQNKPGEINGFKVSLLNNVNNVDSYEVKLVNKN